MANDLKEKLCTICNQLHAKSIIRKNNDDDDNFDNQQPDRPYKQIPLGNYQSKDKNSVQSK